MKINTVFREKKLEYSLCVITAFKQRLNVTVTGIELLTCY